MKWYPLDRTTSERLAGYVGEQFKEFKLDDSQLTQLVDVLSEVKVPPLNKPFLRRRFFVKSNEANYFQNETTKNPNTSLRLDLVITNRETRAKHYFIHKVLIGVKEAIDRKRAAPINLITFYRRVLDDSLIRTSMREATMVGEFYSLTGRVIEKRAVYADQLPVKITRPVLFIPLVNDDKKSYIDAFCKAHQFPHEDNFK